MVRIPRNFEIKKHRGHWAKVVEIHPSGLMTLENFSDKFDCTVDEIGAKRGLNHDERWQIMDRDRFRCRVCGRGSRHGVTLQVDHAKSFFHGGATEDLENLWTLCSDCNAGKSARSVDKINPNPLISSTELDAASELIRKFAHDIPNGHPVDSGELLLLIAYAEKMAKELSGREG